MRALPQGHGGAYGNVGHVGSHPTSGNMDHTGSTHRSVGRRSGLAQARGVTSAHSMPSWSGRKAYNPTREGNINFVDSELEAIPQMLTNPPSPPPPPPPPLPTRPAFSSAGSAPYQTLVAPTHNQTQLHGAYTTLLQNMHANTRPGASSASLGQRGAAVTASISFSSPASAWPSTSKPGVPSWVGESGRGAEGMSQGMPISSASFDFARLDLPGGGEGAPDLWDGDW